MLPTVGRLVFGNDLDGDSRIAPVGDFEVAEN